MSKIYSEEGFVNWNYLYSETVAFCMVTGARATGKTYGLLKYLVEHKIRFMYLRRLGNQLEQSCSITANPFKKLNADCCWNIQPYKQRHVVRFAQSEIVDGKNIPTDEPCAIGAAPSTVATLRGMDFSDIEVIVFDEAIPMTGEKTIRDEFTAFLHLYETVNRNRELEGKKPVKAFLLGNANKLANELLDLDVNVSVVPHYEDVKDIDKTIVIDCAQFHCCKDISILKGKIVIIRTCIDTCYNRCIERFKSLGSYTFDELEKYKEKKKKIYTWYHQTNKFIEEIDKL